MGFTGKQCIHPMQVPVVQEAFTPSEAKIEWAQELIKCFSDHQKSGKVFNQTLPQQMYCTPFSISVSYIACIRASICSINCVRFAD